MSSDHENTCAICLLSHADDDKYTTPCEHQFHHSCIAMWSNMAQTCPMCRGDIGHIEHPQIAITDEQRERLIEAYKLFIMTEDNQELADLQVTMREMRSPYTRGIHIGYPTYDGMKVYLLIKGFNYVKHTGPQGTDLMCKIDSEETRRQFDAMKVIMPGYTVSRPKHADMPDRLILKEARNTRYFMDLNATDSQDLPRTGVLNAIVRPRCTQHNGRNLLQFIAVQVSCEMLPEMLNDSAADELVRIATARTAF